MKSIEQIAAAYIAEHEPRAAGVSVIGACKQVGDKGTAMAGHKGTATAGDGGELRIRYWDHKTDRYRTAIAYVGEDGIKPDTAYELDDNNKFVEVKS